MKTGLFRVLAALVVMLGWFVLFRGSGFAQQTCSTSYCSNEYFFGTGGEVELNSTNYSGRAGAGSLGVGESSSSSYSTQAGFVTAQEEYLEMVVNTATIDLGTLSTSSASTGSGTFYVRAYTSSGYSVKTMSDPPTNGSVTLAPMTVAAASSPGTEQFGINLVANTSPTTFGANPAPSPDNTFGFGAAASGYATANQFKYNVGDTVATAPKGIGQTNFTVSYLANISPISKGGEYTVDHVLVVVATF